MPQFYKKKTSRSSRTTEDSLKRAADEIKTGMSLRQAAAANDLDKMTLHRYLKKTKVVGSNVQMGYSAVSLSHSVRRQF